MEVCTSHYNEDLEWLKESSWPVTVVHKEGGDPFPGCFQRYTMPNVGYEATSYLFYIIERYDTLPDHVAFIHGHETAHHQLGDRHILEMIRDANIGKYNYIPLNNHWNCIALHLTHGYLQPMLPDFPDMFITCSGGQFIVSRSALQLYSLDVYKSMYNVIKTKQDAVQIEIQWHVLYTQRVNCVPRDDFFNPPIKEIKYSTACNIPMKTSDLKYIYVGRNPCEKFKDCPPIEKNRGYTYICATDDELLYTDEEVVPYDRHELDMKMNEVLKACLEFQSIYLSELEEHSPLL
jgi:hypothetical protein